ncbi:hypothetical protein HNR01_004321 [Methylorubrum rhodesianum]|jgi:hypothetical protein|nr:hypothetical protein [Methylorubrum rhodesianum]
MFRNHFVYTDFPNIAVGKDKIFLLAVARCAGQNIPRAWLGMLETLAGYAVHAICYNVSSTYDLHYNAGVSSGGMIGFKVRSFLFPVFG